MPHRYDKYIDDFKKLVAENAARPPVYAGSEKEIWPEDELDIADFLPMKYDQKAPGKSENKQESWGKYET